MVARGLAAQPAADPRHQVLACPVHVVAADLQRAARRHRGPGLFRVGRHVDADDLAGAQGHARVPLGREVQAVVVPGAAVLDALQRPQVEHRAAVAVGDGPHMPVVGGDLAAQMLEQGHAPGVEAGGHHDGARGGGEPGDGLLEAFGHVVRVAAGTDEVVAARAERDQVGSEFNGLGDLLLHDLVEQFSSYGEVGVVEVALRPPIGEQYGEAVGPADERTVGAGIADALGEAVPHGHVRPDHWSVVALRIVCHISP